MCCFYGNFPWVVFLTTLKLNQKQKQTSTALYIHKLKPIRILRNPFFLNTRQNMEIGKNKNTI